jgi:hypothetical protein
MGGLSDEFDRGAASIKPWREPKQLIPSGWHDNLHLPVFKVFVFENRGTACLMSISGVVKTRLSL